MGLFGFFQCALVYITDTDSHMNQVIAGACAGGIINIRSGSKHVMRGMINGGVLIGVFNLLEIFMMKKKLQGESKQRHVMAQKQTVDQLLYYKQVRPDLVTASDEEIENLKQKVLLDIQDLQAAPSLF